MATTRHRMGDFAPQTEPYTFEFEKEAIPRAQKRSLPGRSYVRKVALKDAAGAVYLRRKLRFHCIERAQLTPSPVPTADIPAPRQKPREPEFYPEEDL